MTGHRQFTTGKTAIVILVGLIFLGALLWAKGRDPFQRTWFKVRTPHHGKAEGMVILPKMAPRPLAVVVYLHGSGGTLLGSGNDLRQMAEMGLAAIGMEYNQTNEAAFAEQFAALQDWVRKQKWADPNQVAWVGYSLGAQRQLSFTLQHPERQPRLLVRLAGGWVPELESKPLTPSLSPSDGERESVRTGDGNLLSTTNNQSATLHQTSNTLPRTVFLLHGENDTVFPVAEARRAAAALQTNGFQVSLWALPGQSHSLTPNREMLFRAIGEYALTHLQGTNALDHYESILSGQERAKPLWLFWLPAALWVVRWWYANRKVGRGTPCAPFSEGLDDGAHGVTRPTELTRWEIGLRWIAAILATLALGVTALHLVPPRLEITPGRLELARKHLVAPKAAADFEYLSTNSFWAGKKLKTLLEHVELANYNRELVNWKLDDETYRRFVLSPEVAPEWDGAMHWRRWLWESFYPRIRKENSPEAAAEIIVRHLRERVTIAKGFDSPKSIEEVWIRQVTNEKGFEAIYVAALRSADVPARLAANQKAEIWTGSEWKPAPRPLMEAWERSLGRGWNASIPRGGTARSGVTRPTLRRLAPPGVEFFRAATADSRQPVSG